MFSAHPNVPHKCHFLNNANLANWYSQPVNSHCWHRPSSVGIEQLNAEGWFNNWYDLHECLFEISFKNIWTCSRGQISPDKYGISENHMVGNTKLRTPRSTKPFAGKSKNKSKQIQTPNVTLKSVWNVVRSGVSVTCTPLSLNKWYFRYLKMQFEMMLVCV